jgi:hypothetical protein
MLTLLAVISSSLALTCWIVANTPAFSGCP